MYIGSAAPVGEVAYTFGVFGPTGPAASLVHRSARKPTSEKLAFFLALVAAVRR